MEGLSYGIPYLATGFNASRLAKVEGIRYCPVCLAEQVEIHGEPYWLRIHQVAGLSTCYKHSAKLEIAEYCQSNVHRHEYFPASQYKLKQAANIDEHLADKIVSPQISTLLNMSAMASPSYKQWTVYYQSLLKGANSTKGKHVRYDEVVNRLLSAWPERWLRNNNLLAFDSQSSWLHGITRKHRKSFSYLEHITLLQALIDERWSIDKVIEEVASIKIEAVSEAFRKFNVSNSGAARRYKKRWLGRVKHLGAKLARYKEGGAIYAWLYRHQRPWLLKLNKHYQRPIYHSKNRIDWVKRDKETVKQLFHVLNECEEDMSLPRKSKLWFMQHLSIKAAVKYNLHKLPLTQSFLECYQEAVSDYQIRRLSRTIIHHYPKLPPRWVLLRESGLSDERITDLANRFLNSEIESSSY